VIWRELGVDDKLAVLFAVKVEAVPWLELNV
jgi:hypothetical protein